MTDKHTSKAARPRTSPPGAPPQAQTRAARSGRLRPLKLLKRLAAKTFWLFCPYQHVPEMPQHEGARLLIGAPHTSNFDFVLMLAIAWERDLKIRWLGKQELFRAPFGPLMRALGGISVDRKHPAGVVRQIITLAKTERDFTLVITPEGSRTGNGWKSGFYHIARGAKLPVSLGFIDRPTRRCGIGPTIELSRDITADMDTIRAFYTDKHGVRPERRTTPRLREETDGRSQDHSSL